MSELNKYKEVESPSGIACEPMMEYGISTVESDAYLPDDIILGAAKYANIAREEGRMIPHREVYDLLAERLGWK